jgi:hypothetical protein
MKRSKKSELLIGVMIGVYGNWLIAVLEKLNQADNIQAILFAFSFLPFLWYFQEIFTGLERQKWVGFVPLKMFLGIFYLGTILSLLLFSNLLASEWLFSWAGMTFWVMLMMVERREMAD